MTTPYVVTLDADTLPHPQALRRLVSRLESAPSDTVAVTGAVLVKNSRTNLLTRMQEWDYYLGVATVKRMQGLYQSTLVAQGAFSIYRTEDVRRVGGWPDAIGEDIVVTWRLMEDGHRIFAEPTAITFTEVPGDLRGFMRQRARWARGMFEAFRAVPPWRQRRPLSRVIAGMDLFIPLLDIGYALHLAPRRDPVPPRRSPHRLGLDPPRAPHHPRRLRRAPRLPEPTRLRSPQLHVRQNRVGYFAFMTGYQALCSIASLNGYRQELLGGTRRWK